MTNIIRLFLFLLFAHSILCDRDDDGSDEDYYKYLYKSMQVGQDIRRSEGEHGKHHNDLERKIPSEPVKLPGNYQPLPGRSTNGDYWPLYPLSNQYHAALTFDPSFQKQIGGDIAIPIPTWGFFDIGGHYIERVQDYWTKIGYMNNPVNMLGMNKDQLVRLMSDPSLAYNRGYQPTLPMATIPKSYVPSSCKPPLCNPYQAQVAVGVEVNHMVNDGIEGELEFPIPVGKDIGYRVPISGNFHCDLDDIVIAYGQNLSPIDPFKLVSGGIAPIWPANHQAKQSRRRKRQTSGHSSGSVMSSLLGEEIALRTEAAAAVEEETETRNEEVNEEEVEGGEGDHRPYLACMNAQLGAEHGGGHGGEHGGGGEGGHGGGEGEHGGGEGGHGGGEGEHGGGAEGEHGGGAEGEHGGGAVGGHGSESNQGSSGHGESMAMMMSHMSSGNEHGTSHG